MRSDCPLSTSSSSGARGAGGAGGGRIPWAGLLAVLIVLLLDRTLLGPSGAWDWNLMRAEKLTFRSIYAGVLADRRALKAARAIDAAETKVFVVGSSRADQAFLAVLAEAAMPESHFFKLTHTLMDPFATRATVGELLAAGADVVVLPLSEIETHRPLRIEPLPATSVADPWTAIELGRAAGLRFSWDNRSSFQRILVAKLLNGYRFRDVVGRALLNPLRDFDPPERLLGRRMPEMRGDAVMGNPMRGNLEREVIWQLASQLPPRLERKSRQLPWFAEVQRGLHAKLQMDLVASTVDALVEAGVRVVVLDCPSHPIGASVQQEGARERFVEFAQGLVRPGSVRLIMRDELPALRDEHFRDLLHLSQSGATIATGHIVEAVRALLP